jgi:hypothetical protein
LHINFTRVGASNSGRCWLAMCLLHRYSCFATVSLRVRCLLRPCCVKLLQHTQLRHCCLLS